ncbi:hypothetical protein ACW9YV_08245 [Paraburkholderia strydomiana]
MREEIHDADTDRSLLFPELERSGRLISDYKKTVVGHFRMAQTGRYRKFSGSGEVLTMGAFLRHVEKRAPDPARCDRFTVATVSVLFCLHGKKTGEGPCSERLGSGAPSRARHDAHICDPSVVRADIAVLGLDSRRAPGVVLGDHEHPLLNRAIGAPHRVAERYNRIPAVDPWSNSAALIGRLGPHHAFGDPPGDDHFFFVLFLKSRKAPFVARFGIFRLFQLLGQYQRDFDFRRGVPHTAWMAPLPLGRGKCEVVLHISVICADAYSGRRRLNNVKDILTFWPALLLASQYYLSVLLTTSKIDRKSMTFHFENYFTERASLLGEFLFYHLTLEALLTEVLKRDPSGPSESNLKKLTFFKKSEECLKLGKITRELHVAVIALNKVRNQYAHELGFEI